MAIDVNHIGEGIDLEFSEDFEVRVEKFEAVKARIESAPIAVSAALADFTAVADPYQAKVIHATDSTIRLVAPAGSGKTQTMINRVLSQVRDGLSPSRILMLTFDRSAASSLQDKLSDSLNEIERSQRTTLQLDGLEITTLNAFGYRTLKEFTPQLHKPLVKPYMQQKLVQDCLHQLQAKSAERYRLLPQNLQRRYYLDFFSFLKNQLHDPRNLNTQEAADLILDARQATAFFEEGVDREETRLIVQAVIWLYKAYDHQLQSHAVMDFDDQKLRAYVMLTEEPGARTRLQNRFAEIIVDEFQDINKLDFELIRMLAERARLIVTGDDDQAIYGFRGCSPEFIIELEKHLGRVMASYELSINYRSPANIVAHADRLIRHNTHRIHKNPRANNPRHSAIHVVPTMSASLEAKSITTFIKTTLASNTDLRYDDMAVLYRTNAQSLPIQVEFILSEIPYFVRDEDNILENDSLTRLLSVLRAKVALEMHRPIAAEDQVNIAKAYFRYVDTRQTDRLRAMAMSGTNLFDRRNAAQLAQAMPKAAESQILAAFEEVVAAPTLDKALDVLRRRFNGLKGMVGSLEQAVEQQAPLAEVFDIARDYKGQTDQFVATMDRAIARAKSVRAGHDENGVALLTYFRSKGRQWHTVILTSCNEGIIPHAKAPVEEERRLFYVALTRASANLLVSYVENACDNKVKPSRFLTEAGLL